MPDQYNIDEKLRELEFAVTRLAACGLKVTLTPIYERGTVTLSIALPGVAITEQGRFVLQEEQP